MDYADVSGTFVRLADTHFVQRCPSAPDPPPAPGAPPPPAPTLVMDEKDMYVVPRLNLVGEEPGGAPVAARGGGPARRPRPVTPLRGWAGRGKRRRSCDEEEEEESGPRAKRQKQDGESAEVPGPRGGRRQPPAPRPGPRLGTGDVPGDRGRALTLGRAPSPG